MQQRIPNLDPCPVIRSDGSVCGAPSAEMAPFSICGRHALKLYHYVSRFIGSEILDAPAGEWTPGRMLAATEIAGADMASRERDQARITTVYYVQVGPHIKIGRTERTLRQRMNQYPPSRRLLATEVGPIWLEAKRHQQFRHLLDSGNEWFRPGPDLIEHVNSLREVAGALPIRP